MELIKLFLDEHMPHALASGLRQHGFDLLIVEEVGRKGCSDRDQLSFALELQRVLVTRDSDYIVLAQIGTPHAGIIFVPRARRSIGDMLVRLEAIRNNLSGEEMVGRVEFL